MRDPKPTDVTAGPRGSEKITAEDLGLRWDTSKPLGLQWSGPATALIAAMSPIWPPRALRDPRVTPTPKNALAAILRRESGVGAQIGSRAVLRTSLLERNSS